MSTSDLLTPDKVAELLHISPRTLANWRWLKRGPAYVKLGERKVLYRQKDLDFWMDEAGLRIKTQIPEI